MSRDGGKVAPSAPVPLESPSTRFAATGAGPIGSACGPAHVLRRIDRMSGYAFPVCQALALLLAGAAPGPTATAGASELLERPGGERVPGRVVGDAESGFWFE